MFFLFSSAIGIGIAAIWLGLLSMLYPCNASTTTSLSVSADTTTVTLGSTETIAVVIPGQNNGRSHTVYFARDSSQESARNSSGSASGTQINQMDLLSGVPTLLLTAVGIVQLWPSSSNVCQGHVREFLTWLKTNIERDFAVTLFSCTGRCHTSSFDFSSKMVKRRISADIRSSSATSCTGNGHISVEEFVAIIQQKDSGSVVIELARIARYPKLKELSMAIRILRFSSAFKNQVVFLQWLNIAMIYIFNWILRERLPDLLYWLSLSVTNAVRIVFRIVPLEYSPRKSPVVGQDMADLAMYHVVNEHVPWIRYGIYHLLMSASGRQLTIEANVGNKSGADNDDDDLDEPDYFSSSCPVENENHVDIKHPTAKQRDLAIRMASDQCSAARFLYSISLHSLRVNLIGSHIGYPPPNVLLGSFRTVKASTQWGQITFKHEGLRAVFKNLYSYRCVKRAGQKKDIVKKDPLHRIFKGLERTLGSTLGSAIAEQYSVHVLVNLAVHIYSSEYVVALMSPSGNNADWDQMDINRLDIETSLKRKLVWGHCKKCEGLIDLLKDYVTTTIHWGASMWLLYGLYDFWCQYLEQYGSDVDSLHSNMWTALMLLNKIIYAPYKIRQKLIVDKGDSEDKYGIVTNIGGGGDNNNSDRINKVKVHRGDLVGVNFERDLNHAAYRNSVPAWCLCEDRCRGICTLIVENCVMKISNNYYFHAPYTFSMHRDFKDASILDNSCALICLADQNMLLEFASLGTYFRRYEHKSADEQPPLKLGFVETGATVTRLLDMANAEIYYSNRRHKRIDETQYLLSRLLYEYADQIVVVFNAHIYCVGVRRDGSKLKWPMAQRNDTIEYWDNFYGSVMVNKAISLDLPQVLSYVYTKSAGMSSMLGSLAQDKFPEIRNRAEDGLLEDCDKLQTIYL